MGSDLLLLLHRNRIGTLMIKWIQVLALALLAMLGLVACSAGDTATVVTDNQTASVQNAGAITLPEGKPAFLISYADWWPTWRANRPIVDGLQAEFSDEIEFVWLNIDDSNSLPLRQEYGIVGRTNYVLVDAAGNPLQRWYGYLSEPDVAAVLEEFIAQQG